MASLTRDQIMAFTKKDLPLTEVKIDEWGGSVWLRKLRAYEHQKLRKLINTQDEDDLAHVKVVILAACDEHGKPLWTEADAVSLGNLSHDSINFLSAMVIKENTVSAARLDEKKKESEKTPNSNGNSQPPVAGA